MILINDGSTDRTGAVIDELAAANPEIKVIHHPQCRGVGNCYREGLALAKLDRVTMIPGDRNCEPSTWEPIFRALDQADIVIGYRVNQFATRPLHRVVLSRLFTRICGLLLGVWLKDFHGLAVCPTRLVQTLDLRAVTYGYQMQILVELSPAQLFDRGGPAPSYAGRTRNEPLASLEYARGVIRMIWRLTFRWSRAAGRCDADRSGRGSD